jgi:hypothetical protein
MHGYFGNLEARELRGHFYYSKERDYFWHFATCADIAWSFFFCYLSYTLVAIMPFLFNPFIMLLVFMA